ncbi:MAG: ATP-binding cassette domain-containing protein [Deltaproteobacteria bacterium]|nr:ATP-binding cassette domain-containing protein [Deltaproteobacteria bacterium]
MENLLEIKNLSKSFPIKKGFWGKKSGAVQAVQEVSLFVRPGEVLGLVGESGCGKSTLGRTILKLLEPDSGQIFFGGRDITGLDAKEMTSVRREMQIIFQDPYSSLNPRMTVGQAIAEPLHIHNMVPRKQRRDRASELLEMVGLSAADFTKYPHEFSGGQRQRIGIARALAVNPKLLIADEPVSALDVSIQAQIINLLSHLKDKLGLSMIFIAHDLNVVEHISDRIAIMYLGKVMEVLDAKKLLQAKHPYTRSLLSAIPVPDPTIKKERIILKGDVPSASNPPTGCVFHTRCPIAEEKCTRLIPPLRSIGSHHDAACHLV